MVFTFVFHKPITILTHFIHDVLIINDDLRSRMKIYRNITDIMGRTLAERVLAWP